MEIKMKIEQFFGENYQYIWSDNWCLDKDKVWFVAGAIDILFCLDRKTNKTLLVDKIPSDTIFALRQHPICIKKEDRIFCFPDIGRDIWCYHINDKSWTSIKINYSENIRIGCERAWIIENEIYVLSSGLNKILEINVSQERIEHYHDLMINHKDRLSESIRIDNCIYTICSKPVKIIKFNCLDKSIKKMELPQIDDSIQTLCFDGAKFWMTGLRKKIYVWEENTNKLECLNHFPEGFGLWNFSGQYADFINKVEERNDVPLFLMSSYVNGSIWLIPFQTNEILYVNKDTYKIEKFHLEDETYTEDNVDMQLLNTKYILLYVESERYIGLFSLKNKWIVEIDTYNLKYKILDYCLDEENIAQLNMLAIQDVLNRTGVYYEEDSKDFESFNRIIWFDHKERLLNPKWKVIPHDLGDNIYSNIKNEKNNRF